MVSYTVIFITHRHWNTPPYNDAVLANIDDEKDVRMVWQGQTTASRDYLVTDGKRVVHVFTRKRPYHPYTYRGIVKNETIQRVYHGKPQEKIPSSYSFQLQVDNLPIPYGQVIKRITAPQVDAVNSLGMTFRFQQWVFMKYSPSNKKNCNRRAIQCSNGCSYSECP